ncbi:MAG: hypothetical protein PHW24_00780 [Candidatus Moranbacteria bacterium]|nr:hypothetical protein [Candidatus Moranbacteria bacterium]
METENELTVAKEVDNSLVVYSRFNGDLSKAVQKAVSISDINPQHRVLVDGGMYVASATNLELNTLGFKGFLYLAFYQDMTIVPEGVAQSLSVLVLNKLFKNSVFKSVEYEGREYQRMWRLWSGEKFPCYVGRDTIGEMKVRLVEKHKLLLSNDLLSVLFNPVLDALREAHVELGKF